MPERKQRDMEKVPAELMKEFVSSQAFTNTADIMEAMKTMFADVLQQVMESVNAELIL